MSPRTGRPKKENAITSRVAVRIDQDLLLALEEYCKSNSITKGEVVRKALRLLLGLDQ